MGTEFTDRRHSNPDYELEAYITGVRLGDTGKVNWWIRLDEDTDKLTAAEIFEKAAEVLRAEYEPVQTRRAPGEDL